MQQCQIMGSNGADSNWFISILCMQFYNG
uniref:Uncharacterized protein n=1 Tax=Anguilla anguilla TaxID=7936 RepID=A0A0E9UY79_ANGAN